MKWGLALDQNRGPHAGGCGTCTPLVTVNTSGAVSYPIDFYTLGHFSRFVLSGAHRVYSSNGTGHPQRPAFVNPDGSKALVAVNDTKAAVTFQVRWGRPGVLVLAAGIRRRDVYLERRRTRHDDHRRQARHPRVEFHRVEGRADGDDDGRRRRPRRWLR